METIPNGAILDPRSAEQQAKDYTHFDVLGGAVVVPVWTEKTTWKILSLRKQITSSSCGAQSAAKILEDFYKPVISATPTYKFRANYPSEGMYMQDIGDILQNIIKRTTTEALSPSQNMTEEQMNAAPIPDDRPNGISGYYTVAVDSDLIAAALDKGHGIIFGLSSNGDEWQSVPVFNGNAVTFSHFVACVSPNYTLHNGEKSFIIDDSCNAFSSINNTGQRILTESFIKHRVWGVLAIIPVVPPTKPVHTFNVNMVYGQTSSEVKALQQCLIWEGLLKSGFDTGYFGSLTLKAVMDFQTKYKDDILVPSHAENATGKVLNFTRAKLNQLYSK